MAKFKFTCSIGFVTGKQEEVVEISDDELDGLSEEKRNDYIEEEYVNWRSQFLDGGWHEL